MRVICVNGKPRSGKDTFCEMCKEFKRPNIRVENISTVDFVKEIAKKCGWDGEKTPKNRAFLSDLKKLLTDWNDVPYKKIVEFMDNWTSLFLAFSSLDVENSICFVHVREPKEIQKFVDRLGAKTLLVRRPDTENEEQSNASDADVFDFDYDYVIMNDGDLSALKEKAKEFIEKF